MSVEMSETEPEIRQLREWWLFEATKFLLALMVEQGLEAVPVRVSCGWPSRGGMGQGKHVIGQCFAQEVCADGVSQIFVSPRIHESIEVLGTLLHELIHASVGCRHGHKKPFSQAAHKVGLVGPPTATSVGPELQVVLQNLSISSGHILTRLFRWWQSKSQGVGYGCLSVSVTHL